MNALLCPLFKNEHLNVSCFLSSTIHKAQIPSIRLLEHHEHDELGSIKYRILYYYFSNYFYHFICSITLYNFRTSEGTMETVPCHNLQHIEWLGNHSTLVACHNLAINNYAPIALKAHEYGIASIGIRGNGIFIMTAFARQCAHNQRRQIILAHETTTSFSWHSGYYALPRNELMH